MKEIDEVIRRVRDSVDRLAEYRAALITAAVTGKLAMQCAAANAELRGSLTMSSHTEHAFETAIEVGLIGAGGYAKRAPTAYHERWHFSPRT